MTHVLTNVMLRFIVRLPVRGSIRRYPWPVAGQGVNVKQGHMIYQAVADAHGLSYVLLT